MNELDKEMIFSFICWKIMQRTKTPAQIKF